MPTYEYECTACGQHIEVFQRISEEPLKVCGVCGGALRKVFHPAGIVFKGSGFYATDSRSKAKQGPSEKTDKAGDKAAPSKTETGAASSSTEGGSKGKDGGGSKTTATKDTA
ncbi:MAG: FmdB family transcriptional regulator [Actinobacteria bacterium]|nr:FmdB family transcriptional regulator [Actinomycetota bacterium]